MALVTPTLTWANELDTHLTKLHNEQLSAPQEDHAIEGDLRGDVAISNSTAALLANYENLSTMEPLAQVSN